MYGIGSCIMISHWKKATGRRDQHVLQGWNVDEYEVYIIKTSSVPLRIKHT